jgi:hypothetical protein
MKFEEALGEAFVGRCDGFKRPFWANYLVVEERDLLWDITRATCNIRPVDYLADDYVLVNPKPRTEKREVKGWVVLSKDTGEMTPFVTTYEVEVPRKVKRREEIQYQGTIMVTDGPRPVPVGAKFFAEWEE